MIDIKYRQEKVSKALYVIPALLVAAGILFITFGLSALNESSNYFLAILIPVLFILGGVLMFVFTLKEAKKTQQDIIEVREKGLLVDGEVLDIETHEHYSSDGDGGTNVDYTYNFIVRFNDPNTLEPVVAESVETFQRYELKGPNCQLRVYNGKVLVEKAEVEEAKSNPKAVVFAIVAFVILFLVVAAKWLGLF